MRILIFGAGIIGSIFGAMLAKAGHDVTFYVRPSRRLQIEQHGILLTDELTGDDIILNPALVEHVTGDYDLVLVAIRKGDIDKALPQLSTIGATTPILFMVNCPLEIERLLKLLGPSRTHFGFPGAGGMRDGARIRYAKVGEQPSTFGPVRGQSARKSKEFAALFSRPPQPLYRETR